MFNIEEFNSYIKEHHNKNLIFILNNSIQNIINENEVCVCENIEKLVISVMKNEFYVEVLNSYMHDYEQSYISFNKTFINYTHNRFNYFFCTFKATNSRTIVIFPLKYRDPFYNKLSKISTLKAFL